MGSGKDFGLISSPYPENPALTSNLHLNCRRDEFRVGNFTLAEEININIMLRIYGYTSAFYQISFTLLEETTT
jgi:hypothetical protein